MSNVQSSPARSVRATRHYETLLPVGRIPVDKTTTVRHTLRHQPTGDRMLVTITLHPDKVTIYGELYAYRGRVPYGCGQLYEVLKSWGLWEQAQWWRCVNRIEVAGTSAQMAYLAKMGCDPTAESYDQCVKLLRKAKLLVDRDYVYGTDWLINPLSSEECDALLAAFARVASA